MTRRCPLPVSRAPAKSSTQNSNRKRSRVQLVSWPTSPAHGAQIKIHSVLIYSYSQRMNRRREVNDRTFRQSNSRAGRAGHAAKDLVDSTDCKIDFLVRVVEVW